MDKKKVIKEKVNEVDTVNDRTLKSSFFNIRTDTLPTGNKKGIIKRALYKNKKKKEEVPEVAPQAPVPVAPEQPQMPMSPAGGGNEVEWTNNSQKYAK